MKDIVQLKEDVSQSSLYSEDLAPVPPEKRTWSVMDLAAIWVGMAVCIPTYLLSSYMITVGLLWYEALLIIGAANVLVCLPMILNGHAGVKYGIPFPVLGRASFGYLGVHVPALARGLVACGWFGIQTWIGGGALYVIFMTLLGQPVSADLDLGKFIGFGVFWLINMFFIWKGTESIRWLEAFAAPLLILMGLFLIGWGANRAGGFGVVLEQSKQLSSPTASLSKMESGATMLVLNPLKDVNGSVKATDYQVFISEPDGKENGLGWKPLANVSEVDITTMLKLSDLGDAQVKVQFRLADPEAPDGYVVSSMVNANPASGPPDKLGIFLFWLTAMVGFWATMAISIADITRYAKSQKDQVLGQVIGLPGTMVLYSFVGVFVTCAALINFGDILIGEDAPWDPVMLIAKFDSTTVVIVAQIFMLIATLSTNIAANVIAPANAFANAFPEKISFRLGGIITGFVGIAFQPWALMGVISGFLIGYSAVLGPVIGVILADYLFVRRTKLDLAGLYKTDGPYRYTSGVNGKAVIALLVGIFAAFIGMKVPALKIFYDLSWFTGVTISVIIYYLLMLKEKPAS